MIVLNMTFDVQSLNPKFDIRKFNELCYNLYAKKLKATSFQQTGNTKIPKTYRTFSLISCRICFRFSSKVTCLAFRCSSAFWRRSSWRRLSWYSSEVLSFFSFSPSYIHNQYILSISESLSKSRLFTVSYTDNSKYI